MRRFLPTGFSNPNTRSASSLVIRQTLLRASMSPGIRNTCRAGSPRRRMVLVSLGNSNQRGCSRFTIYERRTSGMSLIPGHFHHAGDLLLHLRHIFQGDFIAEGLGLIRGVESIQPTPGWSPRLHNLRDDKFPAGERHGDHQHDGKRFR